MRYLLILCVSALCLLAPLNKAMAAPAELLNVSYDPTRNFYEAYNALFAKHWKKQTGQRVSIKQSHGGSGKQARSVIEGLRADVVTLALAYDIDMIAHYSKRIPENWQDRLPHRSTPYYSTIVFLVRKGNPKQIHDWDDLVRSGVQVIMPNPKTSGGARWNHMAAWAYAMKAYDGDEKKAQAFMRALYRNVPMMDAGARGATTSFAQRGIGDVLIGWENEAYLAKEELGEEKFEIVMPSISIRAEPPVAVVDWVAKKKGTQEVAKAYLAYLYSAPAQKLIAKHHFRPVDDQVKSDLPDIEMKTIDDFGGWAQVQKKHFADDGVFDKAYLP